MLPDFVNLDGKKITIKEYCKNHCPQRFNSECWGDCDLERDMLDEDAWMDNDDDYEDD